MDKNILTVSMIIGSILMLGDFAGIVSSFLGTIGAGMTIPGIISYFSEGNKDEQK